MSGTQLVTRWLLPHPRLMRVPSLARQIETPEGTTIHPVWSEDRQDWVPLGELLPGETLRAASVALPVYNIEIHGEHVYQVGQLGLLVHNACKHIDGGVATADQALDGAYLGKGYRDMGLGRYLLADGLRQVRLGAMS